MNSTQSRPRAPGPVPSPSSAPGPPPEPGLRFVPSDAEIIRLSVREPQRFTELFERHWSDLLRFCTSRAGAAGEDIAAETFQVAFDQRRRYDLRYSQARPWLFGIATHRLADHFRAAAREDDKRRRSRLRTSAVDPDDALGALESQLLGPELVEALGSLPSADRDALLLLAWGDLDYEQIAQALRVPVGTVRSRIHRARRRLREYLTTPAETEREI